MRLPAKRRALLLATAACPFLFLTSPGLAQDVTDDKTETRFSLLGTITLYADRLGKALTDVQGHISVVEGDEITERNVQSLEDLLRYIPGVTPLRQALGADPFGGQTGVQIRGVSGNRVQMVIDGGRIPERIVDGSRDYLDFNFTKQVDVVRGPASVLWGADALGGVLALQTIDPEDLLQGRTQGGQVTLGYGEVTDSTNLAAAYAWRLGSDVALMVARSRTIDHELTLSNADPEGGPWTCPRPTAYGSVGCNAFNPLDRTTDRTLVKLVWDIDDSQVLKFSFDHTDRLSEVDTTTNRSATVVANPRTRDIERSRYALDYEATLSGPIEKVKATLGFSPSGYDQHAISIVQNGSDRTETHDYTSFSEDFLELDIQATARFATGGAEHLLTFGFDGDRTETTYDRARRVVDVDAGTETWGVPTSWNFADGTTQRADLFIQDQITLLDGKLELTPGLRFATYRMDPRFNDSVVALPGYALDEKTEDRLLASFGATWNFDDRHSVWMHYGEGFKMPTFQQLYTSSGSESFGLVPAPWLVPEEVKSVEIGLRGEYAGGFWAVNAFHADYDNFIESFWNIPGTSDYSYRNLSSVKTWGIEVETAWQVTEAVRLTGSLAWMDGEQRAEAGDPATQTLVPPLTAVLGVSYDVPGRDLVLSATATLADGTSPTSDTNFAPPGYGILDLGARWTLAETASLNLAVNNVFDKKYYNYAAAGYALTPSSSVAGTSPLELQTGIGRSVALTLDYRF
ncbi:TonB-dependent receptor domain-containing protein [Xinfangfangia pollutisoli]|uniref:TonB-dependent receptor domain-containing protein n=1 Tax=Xinfangfangia pollutisoli TaxID=2865960 RepID=UPI001CD37C32|nr:TonB-dependent receptor [Xinfangfangia pollutisoli]